MSSGGSWTVVDHGTTGTSTEFENPGIFFMWVHWCDTAERDWFMYGDGAEGDPC